MPSKSTSYLEKDGKRYKIVKVKKNDDIIVLENKDGMEFESHISKIVGYKLIKDEG